jgi:protein-tyrosine phosphatase
VQVLMVCRANVARSPLAQALLAEELRATPIEVVSAGVQARPGDPPARGSVELAARRGLDLSAHRSQPVTEPLLETAGLVLTMSERQRDACAGRAAGLGPRTFTLRELDRLTQGVRESDGPADAESRVAWLARAAHLARPAALPAREPEDISDPIGAQWPAWEVLDQQLEALLSRLGARLRPS